MEVAPKGIKENEIIKILSNPDTQLNPKKDEQHNGNTGMEH